MNTKNYQLWYEEAKIKLPKRDDRFWISIILNNVSDPINVGSFFRLSDNAYLEKIYLCWNTPTPENNKKVKITWKFSKKTTPYTYHENIHDLLDNLENQYDIYIVEITNQSISYFENNFKSNKKIALIFGSESRWVEQSLLDRNYKCIHIPIYWYDYSMNVANSASIIVYEIIRQNTSK